MENKHKRTLVTCALPYANGPVHIGHLAGAYIPGDIYVRYLRMRGEDVLFVCGSDEHGVPITIKAYNDSITPEEHRLMRDVPRAVLQYKSRIVRLQQTEIQKEIAAAEKAGDKQKKTELSMVLIKLNLVRSQLDKELKKY